MTNFAEIEEKRVADKAHREKVEREVELYLCEVLKDENMAGLVMNLIVDGLLPHVTINYREE